MSRGVSCWLFGSVAVVALLALAGCGHYFFAEREPWRHDAEVACLNSGAVRDTPGRVRVSAIEGPGICGADFPIRVSELGDSAPLGYDDEPVRPPGSIPDGATPPRWPGAQPPPYVPPPPAPYVSRSPYPAPTIAAAPSGPPLSLTPQGPPPGPPPSYPPAAAEGEAEGLPPDMPHPYPPGVTPGSVLSAADLCAGAVPARRPNRRRVNRRRSHRRFIRRRSAVAAASDRSVPLPLRRWRRSHVRSSRRSINGSRRRCSRRRCIGSASRSPASNKSPPIRAAA